MTLPNAAVAVFRSRNAAETAVMKLSKAGFDMKRLSVLGKGYYTEDKVVGFYNVGDRIKLWGSRGAFWGALWGLFLGGLVITMPPMGPVLVLGYLGTAAIATIEGAVIVGGLSAIGAALVSIGIPKDSVIQYEAALKADNFLVMAHGTAEEMARAKATLADSEPSSLQVHTGLAEAAARHAAA